MTALNLSRLPDTELQAPVAIPETGDTPADLLSASLCINCRHRDGCSFLAKAGEPITFCELHACADQLQPYPPAARRPDAASEPAAESTMGLCINCENAADCRLPKPPGGVWHCGEYR